MAARIGLVLSLVLAAAGVLSAIAKSGDDDGPTKATTIAEAPDDGATANTTDADPLGGDPIDVPDGFEVRHGNGLSLAVPSDWRSLDDDDLRRMMSGDNIEAAFPDADDSMITATRRAIEGGALFMAIDTDGPDRGRSINAIEIPGEAPLAIVEGSVDDELQDAGIPALVLESGRRDTPLGKALRVRVRETVAGRDVEIIQYYVPFDGSTYIITGTGTDDIVDQAVQTLRVGDTV